MPYFVYLKDKDGEVHSTICKDKKELNNLVSNLDGGLEIISINQMTDDFRSDFVEFCKKNNNLETGEK